MTVYSPIRKRPRRWVRAVVFTLAVIAAYCLASTDEYYTLAADKTFCPSDGTWSTEWHECNK